MVSRIYLVYLMGFELGLGSLCERSCLFGLCSHFEWFITTWIVDLGGVLTLLELGTHVEAPTLFYHYFVVR